MMASRNRRYAWARSSGLPVRATPTGWYRLMRALEMLPTAFTLAELMGSMRPVVRAWGPKRQAVPSHCPFGAYLGQTPTRTPSAT